MGKCSICNGRATNRKCRNCNAYVCVFCANVMNSLHPCPKCGETDLGYKGR